MTTRFVYKTYRDTFGVVTVRDRHEGLGMGIREKKDMIKKMLEERIGIAIKSIKTIVHEDETIDLFP